MTPFTQAGTAATTGLTSAWHIQREFKAGFLCSKVPALHVIIYFCMRDKETAIDDDGWIGRHPADDMCLLPLSLVFATEDGPAYLAHNVWLNMLTVLHLQHNSKQKRRWVTCYTHCSSKQAQAVANKLKGVARYKATNQTWCMRQPVCMTLAACPAT